MPIEKFAGNKLRTVTPDAAKARNSPPMLQLWEPETDANNNATGVIMPNISGIKLNQMATTPVRSGMIGARKSTCAVRATAETTTIPTIDTQNGLKMARAQANPSVTDSAMGIKTQ